MPDCLGGNIEYGLYAAYGARIFYAWLCSVENKLYRRSERSGLKESLPPLSAFMTPYEPSAMVSVTVLWEDEMIPAASVAENS